MRIYNIEQLSQDRISKEAVRDNNISLKLN